MEEKPGKTLKYSGLLIIDFDIKNKDCIFKMMVVYWCGCAGVLGYKVLKF